MVSLSVHLVTFHLAMPFVGPVPFTCSSAVCKLLRRPITFRSQIGTILIDGRLTSDASPTVCLVNPTSTQISRFCVANDDDGVRSRRRTVVSVLRASYHVYCTPPSCLCGVCPVIDGRQSWKWERMHSAERGKRHKPKVVSYGRLNVVFVEFVPCLHGNGRKQGWNWE